MRHRYREKLLLIRRIRLPRTKKADLKKLSEKTNLQAKSFLHFFPKRPGSPKHWERWAWLPLQVLHFRNLPMFYSTPLMIPVLIPAIEELIRDNGFEPIRVGGIDQSIRIEVFGDLHEFGALGKTVTVSEVKAKNIAAVPVPTC